MRDLSFTRNILRHFRSRYIIETVSWWKDVFSNLPSSLFLNFVSFPLSLAQYFASHLQKKISFHHVFNNIYDFSFKDTNHFFLEQGSIPYIFLDVRSDVWWRPFADDRHVKRDFHSVWKDIPTVFLLILTVSLSWIYEQEVRNNMCWINCHCANNLS